MLMSMQVVYANGFISEYKDQLVEALINYINDHTIIKKMAVKKESYDPNLIFALVCELSSKPLLFIDPMA